MIFNKDEQTLILNKILNIDNVIIKKYIYDNIDKELKIDVFSLYKLLSIIPLLQQQYLMETTTNDIHALNILDNKIKDLLYNDEQFESLYLFDKNNDIYKIINKCNNIKIKKEFIDIIKISYLYNRNDFIEYLTNNPYIDIMSYEDKSLLFELLDFICELKHWEFIEEDEFDSIN